MTLTMTDMLKYVIGLILFLYILIPMWLFMVIHTSTSAYYEAKYTKHLKFLKEQRELRQPKDD